MRKVHYARSTSLLALLVALASAGMSYQAYRTKTDLVHLGPPGRLFNVGATRHHLYCLGKGDPTVVLEAGLGESSLSWHLVQEGVSAFTRVCSYDRPGLGWSDAMDEELTPDRISKHLNQLLRAAKIDPPYVLVGHSRGGLYIRNYYHRHKKDVVGMVLVDSTHEQGPARLYPYDRFGYIGQKIQLLAAVPLSRLGVIRLFGWADVDKSSTPLPDAIVSAKSAVQNRTATAAAVVTEIKVMRRALNGSVPPPLSLDDLPLTVISSGESLGIGHVDPASSQRLGSCGNTEEIQEIRSAMQSELAALSWNSKHLIAEESGHYIMYDQPEMVVQSIKEMVALVR